MTGIERVLSKPVSKEENRYYMKQDEINYLYHMFRGNQFSFAFAAFRYGFEKGRRCEKAKHKKQSALMPTIPSPQRQDGSRCSEKGDRYAERRT